MPSVAEPPPPDPAPSPAAGTTPGGPASTGTTGGPAPLPTEWGFDPSNPAERSAPVGTLTVVGQLPSSNIALLTRDEGRRGWVYKPRAGEAPLWDFPDSTLGHREVVAAALSHAAGFHLVPYTTWVDGPYGEGWLQRWVPTPAAAQSASAITHPQSHVVLLPAAAAGHLPADFLRHWHLVLTGVDADDRPVELWHRASAELRRLALFDLVINNADRKGGHILAGERRLWAIDHGVAFHPEPKLRTILWGFTESGFTPAETELLRGAATAVAALRSSPIPGCILSEGEWDALAQRAAGLLELGAFPPPEQDFPYPWPPI